MISRPSLRLVVAVSTSLVVISSTIGWLTDGCTDEDADEDTDEDAKLELTSLFEASSRWSFASFFASSSVKLDELESGLFSGWVYESESLIGEGIGDAFCEFGLAKRSKVTEVSESESTGVFAKFWRFSIRNRWSNSGVNILALRGLRGYSAISVAASENSSECG